MTDLHPGLTRWIRFFETLTPQTVSHLTDITVPEVHFRDPFHDVYGRDAVERILRHTCTTLKESRFTIHGVAQPGPRIGYVRWTMTATVPVMGAWLVEGMSEVHLSPDGRVQEHLDHWDASTQFYHRLPVVGRFLALFRRLGTV